MRQAVITKSEEWKKGDKWQVQSKTFADIDDGSVMRWHKDLMRPAAAGEERDIRVGVLLYADEVETVDTGYAKSKHKQLAIQVALANLPIDMRFDHDIIQLIGVARHPAVMFAGQVRAAFLRARDPVAPYLFTLLCVFHRAASSRALTKRATELPTAALSATIFWQEQKANGSSCWTLMAPSGGTDCAYGSS